MARPLFATSVALTQLGIASEMVLLVFGILFKLVEWVKGRHLVIDRFDKYFQPGLPYVDRATGQVEPGDIAHPEIDDALDGLAEAVLRTKGEVVVVPAERMPSATGLAAAYRF